MKILAITTIALYCLAFYTYFGYPALLYFIVKIKKIFKPNGREESQTPIKSISIIVAARNEDQSINEKILNCLSIKNAAKEFCTTQIIIVSDGSTDRTNDITREYSNQDIILVEGSGEGKENALLKGVSLASGEVTIFTDAKVTLEKDSISKFISYFQNPKIGAVSTKDIIIDCNNGSSEGIYVKYEMFIRNLESEFNSLVGLSGSCFAVRTELNQLIRDGVPSDFTLLMECIKKGMVGKQANDILAFYKNSPSEEEEYNRKTRTITRGMNAVIRFKEMLNPLKYPVFSFQLFSHKVLKWLCPIFLIISLLLCFIVGKTHTIFLVIIILNFIFGTLTTIGLLSEKHRKKLIVKVPLYFTIANAAILTAWAYLLTGKNYKHWSPSKR